MWAQMEETESQNFPFIHDFITPNPWNGVQRDEIRFENCKRWRTRYNKIKLKQKKRLMTENIQGTIDDSKDNSDMFSFEWNLRGG